MANDLNYCSFIGRLGRDVETRFMTNGKAVSSFSIACSRSWKDAEGNKAEETEWVNIVAFDKLAEICAKYLKKGSKIYISGRMKTEKYQDKATGSDRYSTKIIANEMQMLDGKPSDDEAPRAHAKSEAPQAQTFEDFDDDIPF